MLLGETVAVYSENRTEHTYTVWAVCTSQETYYVSASEPNRLMLFGERSLFTENHKGHADALYGQNTEFCYINAGGTDSNHWALNG
jgi:hypothetical protein